MARQALNAQHDLYIGGNVVASINTPPSEGYPRADFVSQRGIGGWHSLPDLDDDTPYLPAGKRGEVPYPLTSRGNTLTYNLRFKGDPSGGYNGLMEDLSDFRASFADRSSLALLVVTPWPDHGEEIWGSFCRVLDYDADELQAYGPTRVPSPWIRDPIVSFRQLDGRWLWLNESGTLFEQMTWSTTTGISVTNSGNAPIEPKLTVTGVDPGDDLHVGRDLAGGGDVDLWFRDPVGVAGLVGAQTVVIDFPTRTVAVGAGGVDATAAYDAAASTWWDEFQEGVPPGSHNLWIGPGAGTGLEIEFYSGSW